MILQNLEINPPPQGALTTTMVKVITSSSRLVPPLQKDQEHRIYSTLFKGFLATMYCLGMKNVSSLKRPLLPPCVKAGALAAN